MYRKIDDRLFIEPDGFGDYMPEVVEFLLGNIAVDMQSLIDTPAKRKSVYIQYAWNFEHPQCNDAWPHRIIFLHTRGNYWCQWVYQFAHEYLHHMISGAMTGVISGVMWFEETLCEVSSLYHLYHMAHAFSYHRFPILQAYAPAARDYLNDLTESNRGLKQELLSNGGIRQWLPLLFEPTRHRDHNNAIACRILPCFLQNRNLWKLCSHIGDGRQYHTLDFLFERLRRTADDSYRQSLEKMIKLLLP